MGRLDERTLEELQELKDRTDGETPQERVLAAIARKQGDTIDRLAERHGVAEKTIRNWLDRFTDDPLVEAPYDDERPGRPSKLTADEQESLAENLTTPPTKLGYDRQAWTSSLAVHHIKTTYGVAYTRRHVRVLMRKAGLSWRTARPRHTDADPEVEAEFTDTVQKMTGIDCGGSDGRRGRSVHQTNRHGSTTRLVPTWLRSDGESNDVLG